MSSSDKTRSTSAAEKVFLFLAVFFFIATVVFTIIFLVYYIKYEDKESLENNIFDLKGSISSLKGSISKIEGSISKTEGSISNSESTICNSPDCAVSESLENNISNLEGSITSLHVKGNISKTEGNISNSEITICNSPDCVVSASRMIKKMNPKIDPCQDFYEYACGQFMNNTVLPKGRQVIRTLSALQDRNQEILKSIVEAEVKPDDPQYLINMKYLYKSCVDKDQIEVLGLAPYLNDTEAKDWPTLNSAWDSDSFNLKDLIVKYARVYMQPLYTIGLFYDPMNTTRKVVYIGSGSLGLREEYFRRARNDSILLAYEKYLTEMAVALGANKAVAEEDSRDIVDLGKALTEIMVKKEDARDASKQYNPTTLIQLDEKYPDLGIARAMRAFFCTANISLPDDEFVNNVFPTYLDNLSAVLRRFENRVIQNLFGSTYAKARVADLTLKMRKINLQFEKVYRGKSKRSLRWKSCLGQVSKVFSTGLSKQYIKRAFSEDTKTYMNQMIDNLKSELRATLKESSWLSDTTINEAYVKLTKMKQKIGYPDHNFSDQDIERKYLKYQMTPDNYYNNNALAERLDTLEALCDLRKPVDKNEWKTPSFETNAYYDPSLNEIVINAGMLLPPAFSQTFQDAMNYGAIGVFIGHEIAHGFDDIGSQYDGDGVLRNWWQKEDRDRFLARTKCVINQFSHFHVDRVNMSLRGINVQGESVADLVGAKESFMAYKRLVKEKGEQPTLPGLGLTPDQVFFLSFGQIWCVKSAPQFLVDQILTDEHPPGKYRVIGTLQNMKEFSQAFKCPVGSYMNPRRKCSVW